MVNQKGEFPMKARVSTRVHESTKRLLKSLPYTEAEVIRIGAQYLAEESNRLEWEIGELKAEISRIKSKVHSKEALLQAKQNRLRMVAPKKLDEETLRSMLVESARDFAEQIYKAHGDDSIVDIEKPTAKSSVMREGRDLGYNQLDFLIEVKNQLQIKCQSDVSDISDDDNNEMSDD
ncbi:MAG: hypothetical protein IJF83_00065 [Methanobrevibacter sp.]|nr:hypothetical protein [Methanobrevibacter sp.]